MKKLTIIISLIILIASIPLSLILAQKPFKNAILDYSAKKDKKIEGIEKIFAESQRRIAIHFDEQSRIWNAFWNQGSHRRSGIPSALYSPCSKADAFAYQR